MFIPTNTFLNVQHLFSPCSTHLPSESLSHFIEGEVKFPSTDTSNVVNLQNFTKAIEEMEGNRLGEDH